jgi:type IV pilus assembly protein PilA
MHPLNFLLRAGRFRRAFTLIELLVVIVIIAILMAIAIPAYLSQQTKARDTKTKSYLNYAYRAIKSGLPETNNIYQQSTSLVGVVQASEPELTVTSGNCLIPSSLVASDQVTIDAGSLTTNNLLLCSKSTSGNLWRLSASPSGSPTLLDATLVPLNFSGPEITDASRTNPTQGDGRAPPDSSTGIWEGTTNLEANGGAETNTNGWTYTGANLVPITRDTTQFKFGSASLRIGPTPNLAVGEGVTNTVASSPAAFTGQIWTASAWVRGAVGGETLAPVLQATDAGGSTTESQNGAIATLTTSWQRITITITLASASTTNIRLRLVTSSQQASSFYVDGVQLEKKSIATPYVETNGASSSRAGSRLTSPASMLNFTQGWIAGRINPGEDSSVLPNSSRMFDWEDSPNSNGILAGYIKGGVDHWRAQRWQGGLHTEADIATTFSANTPQTVIAAWSATTISISVNGSAFTTVANTYIPSSAPATFNVGQNGGLGPYLDGEVRWMAAGTGTLTNADATAINGFGNSDPSISSFPGSAQAVYSWDGTSQNGSLK